MKKAICSGYYGFDNFGDEAVLKVLVENFKNKYELTVLSANPSKTSCLHNVNSIHSFDYLNAISAIKNADIFISGGGSLLQDVTSIKSLLYYILLIYFAILYEKEIIIFAQGIGPLNSIFSRFLVKFALKKCSIITVRDNESFELLKKWNLSPILVNDPVFNLPIPHINKQNNVGVQLRSFQGIDEIFLTTLADAINKNYKDKDIIILSLQDKIDLEVCKRFASLLNTKSVTIKPQSPINETIEEIAKLETLISMRFHSCLIGYKSGTKVLPIVYDKKVRQLAQSVNSDYIEINEITKINDKLTNLNKQQTSDIKEKTNKSNLDFSIFDI